MHVDIKNEIIAQESPDLNERLNAINLINNFELLENILVSDENYRMRMIAYRKLNEIYPDKLEKIMVDLKLSKTDLMIKGFLEIGGNHWQKYGKNRIYFNAVNLAVLLGYEWANYNTGNISSATQHGEHVSNTQMRKILSDLDCKLYYDLEDFTFHWNSGVGTGQEYTKEVINLLKKSFQV